MSEPTSEVERQLRMLMTLAAGEPPRRITSEAVRRGVVRRRIASAAAAGAALVLIGGIGVALAAQHFGPGPAGNEGPLPVGVPRFYIETGSGSFSQPMRTLVRATATGSVRAAVRCPWRQPGVQVSSLTPAAHQVFFLVCVRLVTSGSRDVVVGSRIFRFRLTTSGRIRGYARVPGGDLIGLAAGRPAATPDGSELAVPVRPGRLSRSAPVAPEILVIKTRTGSRVAWRGAGPVPGKIFYPVGPVSLTGDGQELAYLSEPRCIRGTNAPRCHVRGGEEVRAVSHAARGGNLGSARILVRQSNVMRISVGFINDAVISRDGSTVILAEVGWPMGHVSVARISAATGRQVSVVFRMRTGNGFSYQFFASDPPVRHFLLDAGPASGAVFGWIDHGRLVRLKPAGGNVFWAAW